MHPENNFKEVKMSQSIALCPICGTFLTFNQGIMENELVYCRVCGMELEVESINPLTLIEAPAEEEYLEE